MSGGGAFLKHAIKVALAYALYYSGLMQLLQRVVMRQRAVVLMYHRVLTSDERTRTGSHDAIVVDSATFDHHMRLLKRRFRVLSLAEFADRFESGEPFPNSSCLITFDDGWHDNLTNALPVLQKYGLPAVVFLPVSFIGTARMFWPEALTTVLLAAIRTVRERPERRARLALLLDPFGLTGVLDLPDPDPRPATVLAVRRAPARPRRDREALIAALSGELGLSPDRVHAGASVDRFVDWAQVEAMSRSGVAFGGHGMDHHLLTQVPADVVKSEIHECRDALAARSITALPTFSYPNGYWTPQVRQEVEAAGYRLAFVTKRGFVSSQDDPLTIRRLNVHEAMTASNPMFLARVVGLL